MLTRAFAAVTVGATAVAAVILGTVESAHADGENCHTERDPVTGQVKIVCDGGGGDPGGGAGGDPGGGSSTCSVNGQTIPCQIGNAPWNGTCYVSDLAQQPQQPPPAGQSPDDGEWYACLYPPGVTGPSWAWVGAGEELIDPVILAYRAIAAMDLDPITIGIVPESGPNRVGLVGLPVWMWVDSPTTDTFGAITESASQGPVSVSATASVSSIVWDMGDGTRVTCTGKGTPYADHYGKQPSPTCGHRYARTSTDQPNGAYGVTATSHWVVEWTGGGQSGTIEFDLTTDPLPIRIGEAQVLTQ